MLSCSRLLGVHVLCGKKASTIETRGLSQKQSGSEESVFTRFDFDDELINSAAYRRAMVHLRNVQHAELNGNLQEVVAATVVEDVDETHNIPSTHLNLKDEESSVGNGAPSATRHGWIEPTEADAVPFTLSESLWQWDKSIARGEYPPSESRNSANLFMSERRPDPPLQIDGAEHNLNTPSLDDNRDTTQLLETKGRDLNAGTRRRPRGEVPDHVIYGDNDGNDRDSNDSQFENGSPPTGSLQPQILHASNDNLLSANPEAGIPRIPRSGWTDTATNGITNHRALQQIRRAS